MEVRKQLVEWVLSATWVLEIDTGCQAWQPSLWSGRLFFDLHIHPGKPQSLDLMRHFPQEQ